MDSDLTKHCLNVIRRLRLKEEIMLYGNVLRISAEDMDAVTVFLKDEFEKEALDFPHGAPGFDPNAAAWAAKTVYLSAQLILYRENTPDDLGALLTPYSAGINAAAIVSADLCLRFLPPMMLQLKMIDSEDALIPILESHLQQWHYSGISYGLDMEKLDFSTVASNPCLHALYCNRIINQRKLSLAKHDLFVDSIRASMGIYGRELWTEFIEITDPELYDKY